MVSFIYRYGKDDNDVRFLGIYYGVFDGNIYWGNPGRQEVAFVNGSFPDDGAENQIKRICQFVGAELIGVCVGTTGRTDVKS